MRIVGTMLAIWCAGALAVSAQSKPGAACTISNDGSNCVRFLACYGKGGLWMQGRAMGGNGQGTLAGERSDGVSCQGTWISENAVGIGEADLRCDNDDRVTIYFTFQDQATGTAIGRGLSRFGYLVKGWSGQHIRRYLSQSGMPDGTLVCGPSEVPIS